MSRTITETSARKGRRREIVFASLTLAASILFGLFVIPGGVATPSSVKHLPLSPAFLPYLLTVAIGVFALIHLLEAIFAPHIPAEDEAGSLDPHPKWRSRVLMLSALLLVYLLLPSHLGMLATSMLVTIVLLAIGGERRPVILFGVGITVPLLVYLFFAHVAQVPLPLGIFEDWM
ncbi:tripartite tricarboxylate transporter TctB family protein [Roseovarius sp. D0-M9]|uniref:tripartite tricarboxylate transporter TctB family protein n=1 Tax=Roseovarius sp. D0-M9 TaxID=3127117 RepID=UPI00300FA616